MVNVYGLLERLTKYPDAKKSVESILNEHKIIELNELLDLIPQEKIEEYLIQKKKN